MTDSAQRPTYDLEEFQILVGTGRFRIEVIAANGAGILHMDEDDIVECVLGLDAGDFHKTMPSRTVSGLMQDVYRTTYCGVAIYTKLQIMPTQSGLAAIISFKKDTSR